MQGRWMDSESAGTVREFMKLLALCHTVIVEAGADPAALKYQVLGHCCWQSVLHIQAHEPRHHANIVQADNI